MLKKETKFNWKPECTITKARLIEAVTTAPILQPPDYSKKFTVTTDASDQALGAVLSQEGKPIAFLSKKFSEQEINWSTHEKEMFAVVYAVRTWKHYLQTSIPFDIITDNIAVSFIQSQTKLTSKQARWMEALGEFNYTIFHKPGATNFVADSLSRKDILGITALDNKDWLDSIREISKKLELKTGFTEQNGLQYKGN
jgi:hypothetical protein